MDQSEPATLASSDATAERPTDTPPVDTPPVDTPPVEATPAPASRPSVSVPTVVGIVLAVVALTAGLLAYQALSDQLDERDAAIDELEQDVAELATDLAALEAGRTELRADVQANQDAIADAGTRTDTLEDQAARLESLVTGGLVDSDRSDSEVAVPTAGDGLPAMVPNGEPDPALGMRLPDIAGVDHLSGDPVAVTAGTPALIMIWAHWCPYCQQELPILQQLVDEGVFADNDIDLLTIATFEDESRGNPFEDYVTEFSFPVIRDDLSRAGLLGVSSVPSWIVVGADGATLGRFTGAVGDAALRQVIEQITAIDG